VSFLFSSLLSPPSPSDRGTNLIRFDRAWSEYPPNRLDSRGTAIKCERPFIIRSRGKSAAGIIDVSDLRERASGGEREREREKESERGKGFAHASGTNTQPRWRMDYSFACAGIDRTGMAGEKLIQPRVAGNFRNVYRSRYTALSARRARARTKLSLRARGTVVVGKRVRDAISFD